MIDIWAAATDRIKAMQTYKFYFKTPSIQKKSELDFSPNNKGSSVNIKPGLYDG